MIFIVDYIYQKGFLKIEKFYDFKKKLVNFWTLLKAEKVRS